MKSEQARVKGFVVGSDQVGQEKAVVWKVRVKRNQGTEHDGKKFEVASVKGGIELAKGVDVTFVLGPVQERGNPVLKALDVAIDYDAVGEKTNPRQEERTQIMELDRKIQDKLSGIFYRIGFKVTLVLCSITDPDQLDAADEWLKKNHPEEAPGDDFKGWLKETIAKWPKPMEHFSEDFMERFPLIARKFKALEGNALIYLRMAEFCGADLDFLAEVVEPIMKAHEDGQRIVEVNPHAKHWHSWEDQPRNQKCFTLQALARYTQAQPMYFRNAFLPDLKSSGGNSDGLTFDWRSQEERELEGSTR
jgi:hypothetical protein